MQKECLLSVNRVTAMKHQTKVKGARSRSSLLRMSRIITMQGFIDLAIVVREKPTFISKIVTVNGA